MADKYLCIICSKHITVTAAQKYRSHKNADKEPCDASGTMVSAAQLAKGPVQPDEDPAVPVRGRDFDACEDCGRDVPINPNGTLRDHNAQDGFVCQRSAGEATGPPAALEGPPSNGAVTAYSENRSAMSVPVGYRGVETVPLTETAMRALGDGAAAVPVATTPATTPGPTPDVRYAQPGTAEPQASTARFAQPGTPSPRRGGNIIPMSDWANEYAAMLKQLFFDYGNRRSADNRSAQQTLGPSEIGTPCDRRLVMSLLGMPACNPGGDGWAAWMGTQGHSGLASMFEWADAGSGRFAVETPLQFPSALVPRGTGDLLDRTFCCFIDHKFMGHFSYDKLRTSGPSVTYRTQIHTYAYGARLRGEKVDRVAIIAWPRDQPSLENLYIWDEPYDPTVARDALKRVDDLNGWVEKMLLDGSTPEETVKAATVADDCRFCPFHLKGDKSGSIGCNGKQ